jgi:DNA-binding CsgD family transcriptional regulator
MRLIPLGSTDVSLPTSFTAALADGVGRNDFAARLLRAFRPHLAASHCTVFALNDAGRVDTIATAGTSAREEDATATALDYMRMGFDKQDTNMLWLARQRHTRRTRMWISHQMADEIANADYRAVCYGAHGLRERLSVLSIQPDGQRISISLYRNFALAPFNDHAIAVLAGCAAYLLSVVQAHARQASGSDARGETRRLLLSGLTHRERQTITCAMSGKTIKETALELGVSPTTVITYRTRAFTRLGIRSQRELMALVGQP